jgi:RES domain-containing protein
VILWRISEHAGLDGAGGLIVGGRWHSRGRPVVYLAESSALAMLETLVHLEVKTLPPAFQLLKVSVPDGLTHTQWPDEPPLPDRARTAAWGDAWLEAAETPLARVPSAVAPGSFNWLLNPHHVGAAGARIEDSSRWPWDKRLFQAH